MGVQTHSTDGAFQVIARWRSLKDSSKSAHGVLSRLLIPKRLGQKWGRLVTIASQRIDDGAGQIRLEHPCTPQLADLLRGLCDRQVAGSAPAVLDLPCCGQTESFFGRLVCFLLGHDLRSPESRGPLSATRGQEFSRNPGFIQGEKLETLPYLFRRRFGTRPHSEDRPARACGRTSGEPGA